MNAAETNITGMLHSQAFLARSKELSVDRSQIQVPSIDIAPDIRFSLLSMQMPHVAGDAFQNGIELRRAGCWMKRKWSSLWRLLWGVLMSRKIKKGAQLCENLCEKNFPKSGKIGKNRKKRGKSYVTISISYNKLRRLGNSEVVTENPRVGSSILSLGTMNHQSD